MDKAEKTEATRQLTDAISKLEAYALHANETPPSSVSKTIFLVRTLLKTSLDLTPKKHKHKRRPPDKDTVFRAVEYINRQRLFIEKLKKGTPAEQELARTFTSTIDAYNKSCDIRIQNCITKGKRLVGFLRSRKGEHGDIPPKIALPQKITDHKHYPETVPESMRASLSNTAKTVESILIPRQSAELFQMKALSLLEKYGIATNPEARAHVKMSPIHAAIEAGSATCTLVQTFSLFPGQTIVVKGTSSLDPKTLSICKLFPETFCLALESTQTGFPHPSQRAGWTLAHLLLPESPQRVDLLDKAADYFRRKAIAVSGLRPEGVLIKKAKALLADKKNYFQANKEKLIALHKDLAQAIAEAAPEESLPKGTYGAISRFYDTLSLHPNPYEWLSETNHQMRESFITKPHKVLLEAILRGKDTDFSNADPDCRYLEAKRVIIEAAKDVQSDISQQIKASKLANEKSKLDYIRCMGKIIGDASQQVILQYLSEDLIYPPPVLTPFECKMQAAAFNHLDGFVKELESEKLSTALENDVLADIDVFKAVGAFAICNELSDYFDKRYSSLKDAFV